MMTLLVFSDSHGDSVRMRTAIEAQKPDAVLFLGDGANDIAAVRGQFPDLPFYILRGNCDFGAAGEDRLFLTLEGVRIYAAHGHEHGVKWGMEKFYNSVYCSGSTLGLYGHTHQPLWQEVRGMQILNPGSIGNDRAPTYALIELGNGLARCRILDCPKN